ncbi:MAG: alpha-2-macroglobulin family protein, partial [Bacteroidia bacterium]
LEWMSFRSPLEPGSEERWKLKISGPKGEAVAAELVTAMYDASLDAFAPTNTYGLSLYSKSYASNRGISAGWGQTGGSVLSESWNKGVDVRTPHSYDRLNTFGFEQGVRGIYKSYGYRTLSARGARSASTVERKRMAKSAAPQAEMAEMSLELSASSSATFANVAPDSDADGIADVLDQEQQNPSKAEGETDKNDAPVPIRTNLQETAFFFPQLKTNETGEIELVFTMPEALTRWKLTGLAHTKDLKIGTIGGEVVTQKDLMVRPHLPRFLREGDQITLSSRVVNLTDEDMRGEAKLQILDAVTMKDISAQIGIVSKATSFLVQGKQTTNITWDIAVPAGISAVVTRVTARANGKADGEENILPVLSNRMLVTESMPLPVRGAGTRDFAFNKLINSGQSSTLRHHQLSLEFTPNPVWYAVKALPYLMEYPHECAEQTFSRYYANALASHVANSKPRIKQIFESWKREAAESGGFVAALEQNEDLKAVIMEETPWVLDAENDKLRQERIALLFDLNRMADEAARARQQLANMQYDNGAFPWFEKMPENRYITSLIVTGFGHLNKLGVSSAGNPEVAGIVQKALPYLDAQLAKDLRELKRYVKGDKLKENHLSWTQIQYLYMRSFYNDIAIAGNAQEAFDYYFGQAKTYWNAQDSYAQGMISLALNRYGETKVPATILEGMRQTAVQNDELGMYWKSQRGWFWHQAPIERQALLIEAFDEIENDQESVEAMKLWLLKNKQTTDWKTTRATVAACNALLLTGSNWLENSDVPTFSAGDAASTKDMQTKIAAADKEAGSGYFRVNWSGNEITPALGKVSVSRKETSGAAWGAMYWQYFEDLDKITFAETPLSMRKGIFREENTPQGPTLVSIDELASPLEAGDKLVIRIELRVDRDMEYVHMKDMRASGLEPINVLSRHRYQDGLSYYESTRDAATHFFFSYLRGNQTYVFEYPLRVSHPGDFSNGISSIQCMYAPEFTSHSEGVRLKVE